MPSLEQQCRAVEMFRPLSELQAFQADTARELDALLPAIVDKAFKAEL
jgi:hypothetical protein